jgi:hypothetical protein
MNDRKSKPSLFVFKYLLTTVFPHSRNESFYDSPQILSSFIGTYVGVSRDIQVKIDTQEYNIPGVALFSKGLSAVQESNSGLIQIYSLCHMKTTRKYSG